MNAHQLSVAELEAIGTQRLEELEQLFALHQSAPDKLFASLAQLSWVEIEDSVSVGEELLSLDKLGPFAPTFFEFLTVISQITSERGPGILGYLNKLKFNYSTRADARYKGTNREIKINLGFLLLISELENTFKWLYNTLLTGRQQLMSLRDIDAIKIPPDVEEELLRVYQIASSGALAVSKKEGFSHPIGQSILRFIIAHELGHLLYEVESPKLQVLWQETAWSDYEEAITYAFQTNYINQSKYERFNRATLGSETAENWVTEFIADGHGFYIARKARPFPGLSKDEYWEVLQIALAVFFNTLTIAYHGDIGTDSHPAPLLRELVIATRQRQDFHLSWNEFISKWWGTATISKILFEKITANIWRNRNESIQQP
jgi:hypothetical protein